MMQIPCEHGLAECIVIRDASQRKSRPSTKIQNK